MHAVSLFYKNWYSYSNFLQLDSLFRMSMQAVRTVPDSVMSSVDGMVDNLSKVLQVRTVGKEGSETAKVGASLDAEVRKHASCW